MFDIKIIDSGYIMADGGAMFGAIPKRAWKRKYECNEENLCPLVMRCIFATSDKYKILVDTGMGNKQPDATSYYQPHSLIDIEDAIMGLGYSSDDVTDVILTHLHFDHCGYATRKDATGKIIPSFKNARYWLSRKQWESFLNPNRLEAESFFTENILPIYDAGLLHFVDDDIDLYEGLKLRLFDGHSAGQIVPYIQTNNGTHVFTGDLIPTSAHVPIEWISAYDICALASATEKLRFLIEAEKEKYTLIYCHDTKIEMSRIKKINDNFKADYI